MMSLIEVQVEFRTLVPGLTFELMPVLEVSLDCSECGKVVRTVGIVAAHEEASWLEETIAGRSILEDGETAVCTPTGHIYPARLLTWEVQQEDSLVALRVRFEYDYRAFTASRGWLTGEPSQELPRWARIHFTVRCPLCRAVVKGSSQSNLSRPYLAICPNCQAEHYESTKDPAVHLRTNPGSRS